MRYLILYEGKGEGCDYTIGCNLSAEFMEASCAIEAERKILSDMQKYGEDLISRLEPYDKITIHPVGDPFPIDLDGIRAIYRAAQVVKASEERECKDRKLYEELKTRFES